jgi:hypothetical protein
MSTPNYITVADLKTYRPPESTAALSYDNWTDDELEAAVNRVEARVEELCQDRWRTFDATVYANGNGKHALHLPQDARYPYPISSITTVKEVDFNRSTVIQTYTEGTDFNYEAGDYYLYTNDTIPTRIRNAIGKMGVWPEGRRNIEIVGTFGKSTVPEDIKTACYLLSIAETLGPESANLQSTGADAIQQQWSDYMVTYSRTGDQTRKARSLPYLTGFDTVDRLLTAHVNPVALFYAVG